MAKPRLPACPAPGLYLNHGVPSIQRHFPTALTCSSPPSLGIWRDPSTPTRRPRDHGEWEGLQRSPGLSPPGATGPPRPQRANGERRDALPAQPLLSAPRGSPGTLPRGPCSPQGPLQEELPRAVPKASVGSHTWASCFVSWQQGARWSEGPWALL